MFAKRHYETIALAMQKTYPGSRDGEALTQWNDVRYVMADTLKADNHQFDRERFLLGLPARAEREGADPAPQSRRMNRRAIIGAALGATAAIVAVVALSTVAVKSPALLATIKNTPPPFSMEDFRRDAERERLSHMGAEPRKPEPPSDDATPRRQELPSRPAKPRVPQIRPMPDFAPKPAKAKGWDI